MTGRRGSTHAVIQARMTSSRLPGKVSMPLAGEPMILRQLERVSRASSLDHIVVATSTDPSDDPLAQILTDAGYTVLRGPLKDVLARYDQAIAAYLPDVVVRLTADCPLTSPQVIDSVVDAFHRGDADYVSNTMKPSFPDGLDVEVVAADVLHRVAQTSTDVDEREHVTLGVYRHPEAFMIENVVDPAGLDNSHLRWTVDTPEDYVFVEAIYSRLFDSKPDFEYADVLDLLANNPKLATLQPGTRRNTALDGLHVGAMEHPKRVEPS